MGTISPLLMAVAIAARAFSNLVGRSGFGVDEGRSRVNKTHVT